MNNKTIIIKKKDEASVGQKKKKKKLARPYLNKPGLVVHTKAYMRGEGRRITVQGRPGQKVRDHT
jgi:hypothetical protein